MTIREQQEYEELLEIFSLDERLKRLIDLHGLKRLNDIACNEEQGHNSDIIVREIAALQTLRHAIFKD